MIDNNSNIEVIIYRNCMLAPIEEQCLDITPDMQILATAIFCDAELYPDETVFVTNDLALKNIANLFFGNDSICSVYPKVDNYTGYKEINPTEEELAFLYSNLNNNIYNLLINEYLIIKDAEGNIIDKMCWNGETHRRVTYEVFDSAHFGDVKPYNNDVYQILLFDSLRHNQFTLVRGPAGSGKSYAAISYLISQLEKGKLDKIIIFCNTVATRDAAKLGFYPGDKISKLLDSQIGNFLTSKFGGIDAVNALIDSGQLELIPLADARGIDIAVKAGVYVTEAQNTTTDLMKLTLQRCGEQCKIIIEGDDKAQVDLAIYEGYNNGLAKASEVFRGQDYFGEVTLKNCFRSKIAARAEFM